MSGHSARELEYTLSAQRHELESTSGVSDIEDHLNQIRRLRENFNNEKEWSRFLEKEIVHNSKVLKPMRNTLVKQETKPERVNVTPLVEHNEFESRLNMEKCKEHNHNQGNQSNPESAALVSLVLQNMKIAQSTENRLKQLETERQLISYDRDLDELIRRRREELNILRQRAMEPIIPSSSAGVVAHSNKEENINYHSKPSRIESTNSFHRADHHFQQVVPNVQAGYDGQSQFIQAFVPSTPKMKSSSLEKNSNMSNGANPLRNSIEIFQNKSSIESVSPPTKIEEEKLLENSVDKQPDYTKLAYDDIPVPAVLKKLLNEDNENNHNYSSFADKVKNTTKQIISTEEQNQLIQTDSDFKNYSKLPTPRRNEENRHDIINTEFRKSQDLLNTIRSIGNSDLVLSSKDFSVSPVLVGDSFSKFNTSNMSHHNSEELSCEQNNNTTLSNSSVLSSKGNKDSQIEERDLYGNLPALNFSSHVAKLDFSLLNNEEEYSEVFDSTCELLRAELTTGNELNSELNETFMETIDRVSLIDDLSNTDKKKDLDDVISLGVTVKSEDIVAIDNEQPSQRRPVSGQTQRTHSTQDMTPDAKKFDAYIDWKEKLKSKLNML